MYPHHVKVGFIEGLTHSVITVANVNKTVVFCNNKPDPFCNEPLSRFVIKYNNEPRIKSKPLILKVKFP